MYLNFKKLYETLLQVIAKFALTYRKISYRYVSYFATGHVYCYKFFPKLEDILANILNLCLLVYFFALQRVLKRRVFIEKE